MFSRLFDILQVVSKGFFCHGQANDNLLKKKAKWNWAEAQEAAFVALKTALTSDTCLALPDMSKQFTVQCDASYSGMGAVLLHEREFGPRPISFLQKTLPPAEEHYCITELGFLSVVYAV